MSENIVMNIVYGESLSSQKQKVLVYSLVMFLHIALIASVVMTARVKPDLNGLQVEVINLDVLFPNENDVISDAIEPVEPVAETAPETPEVVEPEVVNTPEPVIVPEPVQPEPVVVPKPVSVPEPVRKAEVVKEVAKPSSEPVFVEPASDIKPEKVKEKNVESVAPKVVKDVEEPVKKVASSCAAGAVTKGARLIKKLKPRYPRLARKRGEEGVVLLIIEVGAKGKANNVKVLKSSGVKRLDKAAIKAAIKAAYEPAEKDGIPVVSKLELEVEFRLT